MNSSLRGFAILAAAFVLIGAATTNAAVVSWLDDVGTLPSALSPPKGPAAPGNPVVTLSDTTPTGSLWIWLHNDAKLQSVAYDIQTTTPGVIKFTGAQVFQYDLLVPLPPPLPATDIGDRWNLPTSNGTISGDGQQIINLAAVNVDKSGLDPSTRNFDAGWDATACAVPACSAPGGGALFARIDFEKMTEFKGLTEIGVSMGSTLIVENSQVPQTQFFGATINVEGREIPEPASLALAGLAMVGLFGVARRRK